MKMSWMHKLVIALILVGLLVGCGSSSDGSGSAASGETALKVTGSVDQTMAWTEDEVRGMDTIEAEFTNKEGETETHTGVPINALLEKAGAESGAATLAMVADDGYSAEIALDELATCADCIIAFRDPSGFSTVLPGYPGNMQVKGVIELQVK